MEWPADGAGVLKPDAGRSRVGILLALFVMGFATFLNLYATQPMLPQFRQIFHATELMVSLTVSAPALAVALAAPVLGLMADALGRKRVIVTAMLGLAIPTVLSATSNGLGQFIAWRFLQGLFIPGVIAVAMAYISEETQRQSVGSTMATYVSGTVVGGFVGRFAGGLIAAHWGWRMAMVALGLATFSGAFATWWLLPRSTKFVRHNNAAASFASLKGHLRNPQLLATYWVGFNVLFCLVGTFTYVNFYLADAPFNLAPAALASIFFVYLIGAVVTPFSGRMIDRIGYRRALIGAVGISAAGMLITLIPSLPVVVLGLTLAASGAFACQSAASSNVGRVAGKARSSAAGLYVGMYYFGGCVGSIVPGYLWSSGGWTGCVGIIVIMQVITALIAGKLWKEG